tara:strand:- start:584 stop:1159 length:576 start_codon:yes stop_codon:yes gene_type:complete
MEKINKDILYNITNFLELKDYLKLKKITNYKNSEIEEMINLKKELITERFNKDIINLFGGLDKFIEYPILKWEDKFMGGTDYIDQILIEDLKHPIMFGIDNYERPFIAIKYFNKKPTCVVLFQRFSDTIKIWTHGTCYYNSIFLMPRFYNGNFLDKNIQKNIFNLINNKNFIIKENINSENLIVNNVYLIE